MVKKFCKVVGIEVRKSIDYATKKENPPKYYLHCITSDAVTVEGVTTFSAKLPDELVPRIEIDDVVNIVYRSYNGWNTVEDIYHG